MKPVTHEWIEKAEGDFATAKRELRARKMPNYDAVCFHAQQSAEKYLKALLQEYSTPFAKTHDLGHLLDLLEPIDPFILTFRKLADSLNDYAVIYRYPGESADKDEARKAFNNCRKIREVCRQKLGLDL